jgi:tRNA (guanine-N7-)-methyltransferase
VPTERERHVLAQGLPVYRVLYRRTHAAVPALEHLELALAPATAEVGEP